MYIAYIIKKQIMSYTISCSTMMYSCSSLYHYQLVWHVDKFEAQRLIGNKDSSQNTLNVLVMIFDPEILHYLITLKLVICWRP